MRATRVLAQDAGFRLELSEAEGEGFEPPNTCVLLVFKTSAIGRSAIPPGR